MLFGGPEKSKKGVCCHHCKLLHAVLGLVGICRRGSKDNKNYKVKLRTHDYSVAIKKKKMKKKEAENEHRSKSKRVTAVLSYCRTSFS